MRTIEDDTSIVLTRRSRRGESRYFAFIVITLLLAVLLFLPGCRKSGSRKREFQDRYRDIRRDRSGFVHMEKRVLEVLNPEAPTHFERAVPIRPLTRRPDIEQKLNTVLPASPLYYFASAPRGGLWVNAFNQKRICLLDADHSPRAVFSSDPGDLLTDSFNMDSLSGVGGAENGDLWICDSSDNRLLRFRPDGTLASVFTFPHLNHALFSFKPLFTPDGGLPVCNRTANTLEVSLPVPHKATEFGPGYTLLDEKTLKKSLLIDRRGEEGEFWMAPRYDNIACGVNHQKELWIYHANESAAYFFKERQLIRRFPIWPEWALADYRKASRTPEYSLRLFSSFIIDEDKHDVFYLGRSGSFPGFPDNITFIYCFNMEGKLLEIYTCQTQGALEHKGNGLFYFAAMSRVEAFRLP